MSASGAQAIPVRAGEGAPSAVAEDELRLYNAEETIRRMNLTGRKTARWLLDKVRAEQLWCTYVGKTPMWSDLDIRDNLLRMRQAPRNPFTP